LFIEKLKKLSLRSQICYYSTNKEVHGIMLSKAVDRVFKTINICKNYTNNDTQLANFLNSKIEKKSLTDSFSMVQYQCTIIRASHGKILSSKYRATIKLN
jgi:hypothetical protein